MQLSQVQRVWQVHQHPKGTRDFADVFQSVIANARRFFPGYQPALVDAEKAGLPGELVNTADTVVKDWSPSEP